MSNSILFLFIRCVCTGRVRPVVSGSLYPIRGTCLAGCDRPYLPLTDTLR
jgi:hypothetical protein